MIFNSACLSGTPQKKVVVAIDGNPGSQVMARDIAMYLMHEHSLAIGGKAVVLTGSTIDAMNISEKMSLCNLIPEARAVTALVLPQGEKEQVDLRLDAREIEPMITLPGNPPAISRVRSCVAKSISVAVACGCYASGLRTVPRKPFWGAEQYRCGDRHDHPQ